MSHKPRIEWPPESVEGWPMMIGCPQAVYRDVLCPRCKQFHEQLDFHPLIHPAEDMRWYTICPEFSQPIFLRENPALSPTGSLFVCESDFLDRHSCKRLSTFAVLAVAALLKRVATRLERWSMWWKHRAYKQMVRKQSSSKTTVPGPCTQIG